MNTALLIGINYANTNNDLWGCINDTTDLAKLLQERMGFDKVTILTEEQATRRNILRALHEHCVGTRVDKTRTLFLSYSGHGANVLDDARKDELNGKDEVIIPYDHKLIRDDEIHDAIRLCDPETNVVMLWDCCFSGTIGDLKYRYVSGNHWVEENPHSTLSGRVLMLSGCDDEQLSSDGWDERKRRFVGAMTKAFRRTLEKYEYTLTCYNLLKHVREFLKSEGFSQRPQLTSSQKLDATTVFCRTREVLPYLEHFTTRHE